MDWTTIIITLLGGSGLTATVMNFYLSKKKQDYAQAVEREVQASRTLEAEIVRMGQRIEKLEKSVAECMSAHIEEARKSGQNEGRIMELSTTTASQSVLIAQQSATIAELKSSLDSYAKKTA